MNRRGCLELLRDFREFLVRGLLCFELDARHFRITSVDNREESGEPLRYRMYERDRVFHLCDLDASVEVDEFLGAVGQVVHAKRTNRLGIERVQRDHFVFLFRLHYVRSQSKHQKA